MKGYKGLGSMGENAGNWCRLTLVLVGALAGGCAVNQEAEVAKYRAVLNQRWLAAQPAELGPEITLLQALGAANSHNERLDLSGEVYLQALIEKDRAAWNFAPTLALAPTYTVVEAIKSPPPAGIGPVHNHTFDAPAVGQVNLFNGFRDVGALRRAFANVEQQKQLLLDAQEQVLLDVAQTYYQVLRAERSVTVLENSLKLQEERVRDILAKQHAGVARPLDVALTEAQASVTRVSLINARNDVRVGREVISFLMGLRVGQRPLIDSFSAPAVLPALAALEEQAARQRADLLAAAANVEAAKQNVQIAIGRYYPSVTLNLEYFLHKDSSPTEPVWSGLLAANLPVFSAGQIEAGVRQAWSQLRQAKMAEQQLRRQVDEQVAVALLNLQASAASLAELQVQVKASGEAFNQAEQSYNAGLATNLERLAAQDSFLNAQLQLTSQLYTHKVLYLNLLRAAGRLGPTVQGEAATQPASQPATLAAK